MEDLLIERKARIVSSLGDQKVESFSCNASEKIEETIHLDTRENRSGNSANHGQKSACTSSKAEFNRLSGELNSRISRQMDEMMNSVTVQIHSAISDFINNQILPQIQNAIKAASGHVTR